VRWPASWEVVNWSNSADVGYSPDINDMSAETEESPLLRSVPRKRLVQAHLTCAVVICKVGRSAIALNLLVCGVDKMFVNCTCFCSCGNTLSLFGGLLSRRKPYESSLQVRSPSSAYVFLCSSICKHVFFAWSKWSEMF
jgi:hypothetical protein